MTRKILILFLLLALCFSSCLSESKQNTSLSDTAKQADFLLGGVCAFLMDGKDAQSWIASSLKDAPAAEWYAIAFRQMGAYDFSSCTDFLYTSFETTSPRAAVTRQKFALALIAVGADLSLIQSAIDDTIGAQGIMSWVYGLHLIHNGFESALHTESAIIEKLLALQLADGGWALSGSVGNADVTSMTIQALAPHKENELINASLERAITHLVNHQEDDGGYKSYGVLNPETTSQVIVALTSMGIDPFTDTRFIKNGKTLLDALSLFVLEDGSFSHTLSGASSPMATAQAFYSLVSYKRLLDGRSGLYEFDEAEKLSAFSSESAIPAYKWIASGAILFISIILMLVFFFLKKRNIKNFLFIFVIALGLIAFVFLSDFESADDFYSTTAVQKKNIIDTIQRLLSQLFLGQIDDLTVDAHCFHRLVKITEEFCL
ncbi:MAG: hypothetical protein IJD86_02330 [Clostridia bacterium]|nr:hypothetical protein [Clostridia bacterium]